MIHKINKCLLSLGFVGILTACVTAPNPMVSAEQKMSLQEKARSIFSGSITKYQAKTESEKEVLNVITNKIKVSYDTYAPSLMKDILSEEFQYRYSITPNKLAIGTKNDYITVIENWTKEEKSGRTMQIAINSMDVNETLKLAIVTAFVSYRSENFEPKFLETFIFKKPKKKWQLLQRTAQPVNPSKPEMHDVKIIFTDQFESYEVNEILKLSQNQQPEKAIALIKSRELTENPVAQGRREGMRANYFVIFKEPPVVKSHIETPLTIYRNTPSNPIKTKHVPISFDIETSTPYVIAFGGAGFGLPWYKGFYIDVIINNQLIANKAF
ncbi:MAG: hypothetical protein HWE30_13875 [Methylocystaceae bacterium]|nr:hypothetical protein [Methylocystaceae bacterium]